MDWHVDAAYVNPTFFEARGNFTPVCLIDEMQVPKPPVATHTPLATAFHGNPPSAAV